ncbi:6-carboxytetrahydropterin synthase [Sorangium sp. So ce327]|jgi:6-pyruvoyl-tetrahydropterin synthase|uniref:6-carboxy-5,6,7,8-tetrahydropterin synthase n=1 Tax=Sorangium cellulosum (strain So ce56) TaxID=448385 RepID=A9GTQ5_SORC5|nr:6-carboxytetrahydropterin synthase [Sorangium cellulosum]CAN96979.1 6-pyruvoyltetrahydropterin synthase [Sorangium cellulosum So ce56]
MYTVGVRDHIMVAHSLKGVQFGPAQRLHGATYTVSVEVEREELSPLGQVVETSALRDSLRAVLAEIDYRNLDEHPAFEGKRSTPELIARYIHRELGRKLPVSAGSALTITLNESPLVWVRYRAPLRGASVMPTELA